MVLLYRYEISGREVGGLNGLSPGLFFVSESRRRGVSRPSSLAYDSWLRGLPFRGWSHVQKPTFEPLAPRGYARRTGKRTGRAGSHLVQVEYLVDKPEILAPGFRGLP